MVDDTDRENGNSAVARICGRYPQYTRRRLERFAERLQRRIHSDRVKVTSIDLAGPTDRITLAQALELDYRPVELGQKLGPLWATYWVRVVAEVPEGWAGSRVDLYWDSRSEALVWLDGRSTQGLNPAAILRHWFSRRAAAKRSASSWRSPATACSARSEATRRPMRWRACELRRFDPEAWSFYFDYDVLRQLEADRDPSTKSRAYARRRRERATGAGPDLGGAAPARSQSRQ